MKNFENEFTTKTMTQACHNGFTRLVKPFRSDLDSSVEPKAQSDSQSSQTKYRNCVAHSYGFTLAETLITVAILGVVAAITIPAIINHQTESANRTKLKKAMTTYEKALNQMIIENDIKSDAGIQALNTAGCTITTEYFKKVEGSGCRFKTADRIWWDITDIENPLVMLKDKYKEEEIAALKELAKKEDDREVFGMVGRLDDSIGVLRINDKGAETIGDNKTYLDKLYGFLNPSSTSADESCSGATCVAQKASKITTACTDEKKNCYEIYADSVTYYDENGKRIMWKQGCTSGTGENCIRSYGYDNNIPLENGATRSIVYSCNGEMKECSLYSASDINIPLENGGTRGIYYAVSSCSNNIIDENCNAAMIWDNIPLEEDRSKHIFYCCTDINDTCTSSMQIRNSSGEIILDGTDCDYLGNNCSTCKDASSYGQYVSCPAKSEDYKEYESSDSQNTCSTCGQGNSTNTCAVSTCGY